MEKDIGVIIGRFQPFHLGHAWLIKKALEKFPKLIILVGSSNIEDDNNPWSYETRAKMLKEFLEIEEYSDRIIKVDDVIDVPDDSKWLDMALKKIGTKNFVVIGDNEWVNEIFENANYKVWRSGYFKRDIFEGMQIRKLITEKKDWKDRMPSYLTKHIQQ